MPQGTYDLGDRTAIITGAAHGIGLAMARQFRDAGANVAMVDLDERALVEEAEAIGALPIGADVSSTADVERAVSTVLTRTGRIDILVNNAGILRDRALWKLDDEDWEAVIGVHLGGTFRFTRACVPAFRERGTGRVINVTSYTGMHGNPGQSAYAAAKAGIIGFTKTAAKELARFGVTVNAISPNADTRMIDGIPPDRRAELEALIPLGRFGAPDEMGAAAIFLASDAAAYVTGIVLPVDGGLSM